MAVLLMLKKFDFNRRHLARGVFVGFLISIFISLLTVLGHFRPYENPFTAALQSIFTKKAEDIVLLFITEGEYKNGFNGISPLSRIRLSRIIDQLVALKAKVIALDIDLSDQTNEDRILAESFRRASDKGIRIVLPAILNHYAGEQAHGPQKDLESLSPYPPEEGVKNDEGFDIYKPPALLRAFQEPTFQGGSIFSLDRDGIFRNACAFYLIKDDPFDRSSLYRTVPSFPLAMAAAYIGISQNELAVALRPSAKHVITITADQTAPPKKISFHYRKTGNITPTLIGNYEHFNRDIEIDQLIADDYNGTWRSDTIFTNKLVLLGGTFDKRDFYHTPLGRMSGMEINANIAQSILNGTLISHLSLWKAFVIEILIGFIVACIFVFSASALKASIICTILVMPVIVGASILTFATSYYWFDFIPIYAGVMLHGIISKIEEKHHRVSNA